MPRLPMTAGDALALSRALSFTLQHCAVHEEAEFYSALSILVGLVPDVIKDEVTDVEHWRPEEPATGTEAAEGDDGPQPESPDDVAGPVPRRPPRRPARRRPGTGRSGARAGRGRSPTTRRARLTGGCRIRGPCTGRRSATAVGRCEPGGGP